MLAISWWMDVFFQMCIVLWGGTLPRPQQHRLVSPEFWFHLMPGWFARGQRSELRQEQQNDQRARVRQVQDPGTSSRVGKGREGGQEQALHDSEVWLTWGDESLVGEQWGMGQGRYRTGRARVLSSEGSDATPVWTAGLSHHMRTASLMA